VKRLIALFFLIFFMAPQNTLGQAPREELLRESKILNQKAISLFKAGKYTDAEPLLKKALEIREKALGPDHPDVAESLNNLAHLYNTTGRHPQAEPLLKRSLEIHEKAFGRDHPRVASSLNNLAFFYQITGRYADVEPLLKRSLAIREKALGREHPDVATSLNNLAYLYLATGRYREAEPYFLRSLEISEKAFGRDNARVATSLNNMAGLYGDMARYTEAEDLLKRSLAIREKALGREHPDVATSLNNLAGIYWKSGRYTEAEPLIKRAVGIIEKVFGGEHPSFAAALGNMAELYNAVGRRAEAESLVKRSLAIREKVLGREHPDVATSLNNLAGIYWATRRYKEAEPLMKRTLEITERAFGREHPKVAASLNNLAELYNSMEKYSEAEPLFKRSLKITEKLFGREHPDAAMGLNNLAELYRFRGRYAESGPLYERSIAILEKNFGDDHPRIASSLHNLAKLRAATGLHTEAHALFSRSALVGDRVKESAFLILPEKEKLEYINQNTYRIETFISHTSSHMTAAGASMEDALNAWIKWKGSVLEAQGRYIDALATSGDPKVQKMLMELTAVRREMARLQISGPGKAGPDEYKKRVASLEKKKQELEEALMAANADFFREKKARRADVKTLSSAMPEGSAYLDYARVRPYDFSKPRKAFGKPHYLLFILIPGDTPMVKLLDLGPASDIDRHIRAYLKEMGKARTEGKLPDETKLGKTAAALYGLLVKPAGTFIEGKKHLIVSPDGNLNLIPFEVFTGPAGAPLLEDRLVSYVGAGRDMVKFSFATLKGGRSLILADPDYDMGSMDMGASKGAMGVKKEHTRGPVSRDAKHMHFDRLPDTKEEADAIAGVLRKKLNQEVFNHQDKKAIEDVLFGIPSPKVLHLATHGYFLAEEETKQGDAAEDPSISENHPKTPSAAIENPMLRSGIVLAGVNTSLKEGRDDGMVTAEKVLGLQLRGTGLVVLSACETGVGDIKNGEGVFGLKRAFILSGAGSLVMSLWSVPSGETVELMTGFYDLLAQGKSRAGALREAKLALMKKKPNPFFWGAFVLTGEP